MYTYIYNIYIQYIHTHIYIIYIYIHIYNIYIYMCVYMYIYISGLVYINIITFTYFFSILINQWRDAWRSRSIHSTQPGGDR